MKKKINLSENQIRKIVADIIRKKILNEQKEVLEKNNLDTDKIISHLNAGGLDNLAKEETNYLQRGGEVATTAVTAGVVASGTASYLGVALGTAAASAGTGIGLPVAAALAIGAGLYYIFDETSVTSNAVKEALDTTLYTRVASAFKEIYNQFKNSDDETVRSLADAVNPDVCLKAGILTSEEQSTIAQEFYDATQGSGTGYLSTALGAISGGNLSGFGTDPDGILTALKKCKSYLGVSQVSLRHANKFKNRLIDDGNLLKVLSGELDDNDFDTYVTAPIEDLPFLFIGTKSYTKSGFLDWIENTKKKIDEMIQKKKEEVKPDKEEDSEDENTNNNIDYIKRCQALINEYCADKKLDYNPIKPDGLWGPKTNALWINPYLPHVFKNHPNFSKLNLKIGDGKWASISSQLIKDFPGYTSGERGCYNFCSDALAGNTNLGSKESDGDDKPIKYFSGKTSQKEKDEIESGEGRGESGGASMIPQRSTGGLDYRSIIIDVDIVGHRDKNKIDSLPGAKSGDGMELAYDFLGNFTASRLNLKNSETFQIDIVIDKKNKIKIKNSKGTRLFKNMGIRRFKETFIRFFKSLDLNGIKKLGVDNDNPITISIKMPKGVYTSTTERLHENMRKRKILKSILAVKEVVL